MNVSSARKPPNGFLKMINKKGTIIYSIQLPEYQGW